MIDDQLTDVNDLFSKLTEFSQENKQTIADLNQAISQILTVPLKAIVETTQAFQERALSPRQQKELITNIQHLSNECLTLVDNLVSLSQLALKQQTATAQIKEELTNLTSLVGVQTLLIDDDYQRGKLFQARLQTLGLICNTVNLEQALPTLQQALQNKSSYQIIIVSAENFDHQAAYLGRTLKNNTFYRQIMPVLALTNHKPFDFEIERALFSGFNCVLNQADLQVFAKKLAFAWESWISKTANKPTTPARIQRILVVEDEPTAQISLQHQLKKSGFSVDIANDGEIALQLLENNYYDLIFMDIGLPDMSGLEVTAEIRKREQGETPIPIIGLTVYALEEDEQQGLKMGMNDYLAKPLRSERLQTILDKWLKN